MGRAWIAASAAAHDGLSTNGWAEFHGRDEAVALRAVDLLGGARLSTPDRSQGTPLRRRKAHRQTGFGILERLHDVVGQALRIPNPVCRWALRRRSGVPWLRSTGPSRAPPRRSTARRATASSRPWNSAQPFMLRPS